MKNLFKKETEEDKIRNEIQNTEFKKNSMVNTVINEKNVLEQQKRELLFSIGEKTYENQKAGVTGHDFSSDFAQIDALEVQKQEKDAKITEIASRYDEEINLLSANLATMQAAAQAATQQANPAYAAPVQAAPQGAAPAGFCEKCGQGFHGGDAFCQGCGSKL